MTLHDYLRRVELPPPAPLRPVAPPPQLRGLEATLSYVLRLGDELHEPPTPMTTAIVLLGTTAFLLALIF